MDRTEEARGWMSALADGQLRDGEFAQAMTVLGQGDHALKAWRDYHLVGEVLRTGERACGSGSLDFVQRLQARLAAEAAPVREDIPAAAPAAVRFDRPVAANDSRWKIAAGFASFAAVAAIAWNVVAPSGGAPAAPQLAAVPAAVVPVSVEVPRGTMMRDPNLDRLLAAHRQLGSATVLQQPAGFLRNATFEGVGR